MPLPITPHLSYYIKKRGDQFSRLPQVILQLNKNTICQWKERDFIQRPWGREEKSQTIMVVLGLNRKKLFFSPSMKANMTWEDVVDSISFFKQSIGVCSWLRRQEWENGRFTLRKPIRFSYRDLPSQLPGDSIRHKFIKSLRSLPSKVGPEVMSIFLLNGQD